MLNAAYAIPAFPLFGALVLLFSGKRFREPLSGWFATAMAGGSFLATVITFIGLVGKHGEERRVTKNVFEWIHVGGFDVHISFLIDPLALTMAMFVTGIGTLIHLYAIGYMHGDPRFPRFFLYLNAFIVSMLMLVLGDNFLLTFLGWEGVGACSYLLISFWFERESAAVAGKKAFVTNRIGDLGFLIAMFLVFKTFGTLNYLEVFDKIGLHGGIAQGTATAIAFMLLLGACGKSAQLPLFVWLPDAMEGPTPVSALIHAATMVTAGVYLLARCSPILHHAPSAMTAIAIIGAMTALFAATVACAQNDIKRVLAYSTVSQLGYMFLAVGSGAYVAAIFHMVTHAFFKALMFLGSGSVIHGMHDEQDMKKMGGLYKFMPITASTFLIGWLAIAGVPPFAGFWSKDDILLAAWSNNKLLWLVGLITALLTAYYMTRQIILVFFGKRRWKAEEVAHDSHEEHLETHDAHDAHGSTTPHESPWLMWVPLVVLAGLAVLGGGINLPFSHGTKFLETWLEPSIPFEHHMSVGTTSKVLLAGVAVVCGFVGIVASLLLWRRSHERPELEPKVLQRAWYINDAYAWLVDKPGRRLANVSAFTLDAEVIDGAVNGSAWSVKNFAQGLRHVQNGYVRFYAGFMVAGLIVLLGVTVWQR